LQLLIISAKHQRDWVKHLPMFLKACCTPVQDSTSCPTLAVREICSLQRRCSSSPLKALLFVVSSGSKKYFI
jgi:hypothetical protein